MVSRMVFWFSPGYPMMKKAPVLMPALLHICTAACAWVVVICFFMIFRTASFPDSIPKNILMHPACFIFWAVV